MKQKTTKVNPIDLLKSSYAYELPAELIATRPTSPREDARVLVYDQQTDTVEHHRVGDLPDLIPQETTLVFNQTKVYPCRLQVQRPSGGKAELFFLDISNPLSLKAFIRSSRKKRVGDTFWVGIHVFEIIDRIEEVFCLRYQGDDLTGLLESQGLVPIPPYIRSGLSDQQDKKDYQTIFAKDVGSVAAPTAGLHFTDDLMVRLKKNGIGDAYITLHVGAGTFAPVKEENLLHHSMHREVYSIDPMNLNILNSNRPIYAVGTTSLRALESSFINGEFVAEIGNKETEIFLHPGVEVESVQGLLTNFHLPESSLLMLVSSLIGREKTLAIYDEAIRLRYRFYSYGDCMLIKRGKL